MFRGIVQPGEEKASGRPYCCLSVLGGGLKERWRETVSQIDIRENISIMRVVKHWNRLSTEVVDAPSLETFKVSLEEALSNLI